MRAVVQRARDGRVEVDGAVVGSFTGPGLVVLVGVTHDDTVARADRLAEKIWGLRIFDGELGRCSASDLGLPVLVVSQFTLYGSTRKGRRPSWEAAAPAAVAQPLVERVIATLRQLGAEVETGRFGAMMQVTLTNDGPVTLLLEV